MDPDSTLRQAIRLILAEEATNVLNARWGTAPLATALAGEYPAEEDEEAVEEGDVEEWGGHYGRPSGC